MLPIIDPEEDYLTIVAAEEKIIMSETKRKKELEEAHAKLKGALGSFALWVSSNLTSHCNDQTPV